MFIFVKDNVIKRILFYVLVINGYILCLWLLLEIVDNLEVVDVKDVKG